MSIKFYWNTSLKFVSVLFYTPKKGSLRAAPTVSSELKFPVELNSFSDASWRRKINSTGNFNSAETVGAARRLEKGRRMLNWRKVLQQSKIMYINICIFLAKSLCARVHFWGIFRVQGVERSATHPSHFPSQVLSPQASCLLRHCWPSPSKSFRYLS